MASNPPEPPPAPRSPLRPGELGDEPRERCGTVAVARHVKDDGRALILYTRAADRAPCARAEGGPP